MDIPPTFQTHSKSTKILPARDIFLKLNVKTPFSRPELIMALSHRLKLKCSSRSSDVTTKFSTMTRTKASTRDKPMVSICTSHHSRCAE